MLWIQWVIVLSNISHNGPSNLWTNAALIHSQSEPICHARILFEGCGSNGSTTNVNNLAVTCIDHTRIWNSWLSPFYSYVTNDIPSYRSIAILTWYFSIISDSKQHINIAVLRGSHDNRVRHRYISSQQLIIAYIFHDINTEHRKWAINSLPWNIESNLFLNMWRNSQELGNVLK